jgi:hypothetical protein
LKAGRGRRVPPTETSELTDPDRAIEYIPGDMGDDEKALSDENVRLGDRARWLESSSELSKDIALGLGVRCANGDRGGANARES